MFFKKKPKCEWCRTDLKQPGKKFHMLCFRDKIAYIRSREVWEEKHLKNKS